jgi:hypothetical protein
VPKSGIGRGKLVDLGVLGCRQQKPQKPTRLCGVVLVAGRTMSKGSKERPTLSAHGSSAGTRLLEKLAVAWLSLVSIYSRMNTCNR